MSRRIDDSHRPEIDEGRGVVEPPPGPPLERGGAGGVRAVDLESLKRKIRESLRIDRDPEGVTSDAWRVTKEASGSDWSLGTSHSSLSGGPDRSADLLPRWSGDPDADPEIASILFEEFHRRDDRAAEPSVQREDRQDPDSEAGESMVDLFRHHAVVRSTGAVSGAGGVGSILPAVGDELLGFRLRHELGRGSFAR